MYMCNLGLSHLYLCYLSLSHLYLCYLGISHLYLSYMYLSLYHLYLSYIYLGLSHLYLVTWAYLTCICGPSTDFSVCLYHKVGHFTGDFSHMFSLRR